MNIAKIIADALAAADLGVVASTIFVGRIQAEPEMTDKGLWAVTMQPSDPPTTHWKTASRLQVMAMFSSQSEVSMYDLDATVRKALTNIPTINAFVPRVTVTPLQDNDQSDGEERMCAWNVEAVTINSK